MPENFFDDKIDKPLAQLRLLRYPPQSGPISPQEIGCGAHSDFGCVAMLAQDQVHGLQLRNSAGEWIEAPPIAGTLVCNIGHMMARWTNDLWRATPHRVINTSGRERHSIVMFFDPNYDVEVSCLASCQGPDNPPKYAPITMGEHLARMFDQSFAYRRRDA